MTYEQFYDGSSEMATAYRKAEEARVNNRNAEMWLQGFYVYTAIGAMVPALNPMSKDHKPQDYLDKPIPITESAKEEAEREKIDKLAALMTAWAMNFKDKDKK